MFCDGAKVAALRAGCMMSQEKLAAMAKVDRRTVQRMEAGKPVALETVNQVAAPLGVTAFELRRLDLEESTDDVADGNAGIHLKPERSGVRLIEAIVNADKIDFEAAFEPWPEQIETAGPLLRLLEDLHPHTFENYHEYNHSLANSAVARMEAAAKVNAGIGRLASLKPEGLHVLFGQYTVMGQPWHWDDEVAAWCTHRNESEEVLTVAALRLVSVSKTNLWIPLRGKPVPPARDEALTTNLPGWGKPVLPKGDEDPPF